MLYNPKHRDCSIPYKTFNDLTDGNYVFCLNLATCEHYEQKIVFIKKEDDSNVYNENMYKVNFILENDKNRTYSVYDGNQFVHSEYNSDLLMITDERLMYCILDILNHRTRIQWSMFSSIFNGINEHRSENIILG